MKTLLHLGCASLNIYDLKGFIPNQWKEIRFDIDKNRNPDIVGTISDLSLVKTESVDAVYSAYNLDHLYSHKVPIALREFFRVLKNDGIAIVSCPDIQTICESISNDKLLETLYESPAGPISPIDILFGNRNALAKGNQFMAKKSCFTYSVLNNLFGQVGFKSRYGGRVQNGRELFLVAFKQHRSENEIKKIADPFFPSNKL